MNLEIVTPENNLFSGEIKLVSVPGTAGSFEVMPNHAPLISTLEKGKIKIISTNDKEEHFEIEGGVIEIRDNQVIVLCEIISQ